MWLELGPLLGLFLWPPKNFHGKLRKLTGLQQKWCKNQRQASQHGLNQVFLEWWSCVQVIKKNITMREHPQFQPSTLFSWFLSFSMLLSTENLPQMASNGQNGQNGHQPLEANLIGKNHQPEFVDHHLVESNYCIIIKSSFSVNARNRPRWGWKTSPIFDKKHPSSLVLLRQNPIASAIRWTSLKRLRHHSPWKICHVSYYPPEFYYY